MTLAPVAIPALFAGAGYLGLNAYAGQLMASGYCGQFTSVAESKEGCSVVQTVPYDFKTINQLCSGGIDGGL